MRSFIDHSEFESNNTSQLRPHQQEAFDDIIDALNNGQRSGFVEMATGSGKTAIMSKLAELYLTDNSGRVIFLAPSLQICQQINEEIRKHTSVADDSITFMSGAQTVDPAANIIISTYQSYVTKGRDLSNVGLILADECHRSLGPITSGIVKEGHPDSYKIGFSATPSFRANRRSEELFGQPMHNLSLRDAVESGVAQPVEAFVYKTEAEFNPSDRVAKDFTYQELEPLMNNAARNKAGVNLTKELVADGRQGIINCIPGKSNGHARALAEILSKTSIATADGQKRTIIARAVGNHLKKEDSAQILADYEAGKIDVLTFTKALEEGWDSQVASFAINLRPTTSELKIKQLLGRILRKKTADTRPSIYIDLIDQAQQYKPIYTGLHALDFQDGQRTGSNLYANEGSHQNTQAETTNKDRRYKDIVLSQYLLEQLITTKTELDQFEKLSQLRKASDELSKKQFRELKEIISPWLDPTFYRRNMGLLRNPPRLNPTNKDLLSLEELASYAQQINEQQDYDDRHSSVTVGAGDQLDELINQIAEKTEGYSLPKHMARTLLEHTSYFQTDTYTTNEGSSKLGALSPVTQQQLSPEKHVENVMLEAQVESVLDSLSERQAGVIRMRFGLNTGEPETMGDIGKVYGITRERVRQIESKTMHLLRHPSRSQVLRDYSDYHPYPIDERVSRRLTGKEAEAKKRSGYEKIILEEAGILSRSSKQEVTSKAIEWAANLISSLPEELSESGPSYSLQALFNTWQSDFHIAVINEIFKSHASNNHINKRTVIEHLAEYLEPEQHNQLVAKLASGVSEKPLLSAEILKGEDYLLLNPQQLGFYLGIKPRDIATLLRTIPDLNPLSRIMLQPKLNPSDVSLIIENLKNRGIISENFSGGFETNYPELYASLINQAKKDETRMKALDELLSDSQGSDSR